MTRYLCTPVGPDETPADKCFFAGDIYERGEIYSFPKEVAPPKEHFQKLTPQKEKELAEDDEASTDESDEAAAKKK